MLKISVQYYLKLGMKKRKNICLLLKLTLKVPFTISFRIKYLHKIIFFSIIFKKVMNCKNIPKLDVISESSDPYVTIELLPKSLFQDFQIERTNIVYKNPNPVFNEYFCL